MELSDAELMRRVKAGDRGAFAALVERYMDGAYALAARLLGEPAEAEDVVQDAFVRIAECADRYDDTRPFRPWFYRVVANIASNRKRRFRTRGEEALSPITESELEAPDRAAERGQIGERIAEALETLPERQRSLFLLCEVDGLTSAEAAEVAGCAPGTVRWHVHEARKALREALDPLYGTDS